MPSNIRRSRGYKYERTVVDRINAVTGWHAYRLGGTSTEMPDVLAFQKQKRDSPCSRPIMYAIECKTGGGNKLVIPAEQTDRCYAICDALDAYEGVPVGAFKFHRKKHAGGTRHIEEIFVALTTRGATYAVNYDGEVTAGFESPAAGARLYRPYVIKKMPWGPA